MIYKRIHGGVAAALIAGSFTFGSLPVYGQGKVTAKVASSSRPAPATNSISDAASLPSIVATVNGEPVTRDELAALCLSRHGDEVLDNVLNKYLILQACQTQNIQITQKDVDDEVERIASKFNLSSKLYLKLIEDERDITPEQYSADIVWPMLALRSLARENVAVSDEQIGQAIESEFGRKVQVRMIAMSDATKAATVYSQASANPATFKELAKQHSEDPSSASVEGLLPPIRKTQSDDSLEKVAFSLQPGQISEPFKIADMTIFLQCVRYLDGAILTPDQLPAVQARMRMELEDQQLREIAETMFTTLRSQSNVQTVFNNSQLQQQYPGTAAIINRQPIPMKTLEDECIKRFGPTVLETEINRRIVMAAVVAAKIQVSDQDLFNEVARAADYFGYVKADGSPDVESWMQKVLKEGDLTQELYMQDAVWPTVALKKLVAAEVTVTEQDLSEGYEHDYGPRAEVLAIVCSNQRTAQEVWQMARDNPSEQFFGELASQYSVEPTSRSNFGKIPPIRRFGSQSALETSAFKLQVGELSGIINVAGQYVLLKGQGRTQPVVSDPTRVRDELTKDILERKLRKSMQEQLSKLVSTASIDNFLVPKSQLGTQATQASLRQMDLNVVK